MNASISLLHSWSLDELHAIEPDFGTIGFGGATRRRLIPGKLDGQSCVIISDRAGPDAWDWLQGRMNAQTRLGTTADADFEAMLAKLSSSMTAVETIQTDSASADGAQIADELSLAMLSVETNVAVRTLGSTVFDAFRSGASDIHFECRPGGASVKYRLDGVLTQAARVENAEIAEQVVSRIKVLAQLDVGERRLPQDGRFRLRLEGRDVDFRISIIPGTHGEDAVLRILDRRALADEHNALDLARLGHQDGVLNDIRALARRPHGLLLVTGPTGSGKTTTLYGALSEINDGRHKIVTIEDPVEYQLPGILQVPVNEKTGLSFARGLRAILRHDPDTILVGEIRDPETAQIAVQAALTGHLVFSSIHANTVFDVLARFSHMGVDPYELTSALNGVIAQRLLRLCCSRCAEWVDIPTDRRDRADSRVPIPPELTRWRKGRGCGDCRGTGYKGRTAVAEVLTADDELREGILQRESPRLLRQRALKAGLIPLSRRAAQLVADGFTSLEEYERVAGME